MPKLMNNDPIRIRNIPQMFKNVNAPSPEPYVHHVSPLVSDGVRVALYRPRSEKYFRLPQSGVSDIAEEAKQKIGDVLEADLQLRGVSRKVGDPVHVFRIPVSSESVARPKFITVHVFPVMLGNMTLGCSGAYGGFAICNGLEEFEQVLGPFPETTCKFRWAGAIQAVEALHRSRRLSWGVSKAMFKLASDISSHMR